MLTIVRQINSLMDYSFHWIYCIKIQKTVKIFVFVRQM
jgi:hypothetical protein